MTQKEAIALIYALARKSLEDPQKQKTAIRKIAEIIETNFMCNKRSISNP
jgi:hypothetical protein